MPRLAALLLLALCLSPATVRDADAQVRRCSLADGGTVYTDRRCEDIGGTDLERSTPTAGANRLGRASCARSVQDLAYTLGNAIQSGDVNQIAGVYDWAGTSTRTGYRLMQRLETIARRPLVDVQPVYADGTDAYGYDVAEFDALTGGVVSRPPRTPRLVGLRVEQTLANGSTPSHTMFGLRRNLGCWWVRL